MMEMKQKKQNNQKSQMQQRKQKMLILRWARVGIQIIFFVLYPAVFSQAFGAIKDIATAIGKGEAITWTIFTTKLMALIIITAVAGRVFCGWACSFGAIGDWVYQIGQAIQEKIKKKIPKLPEKVQMLMQKMKYLILLFVLLMCFIGRGDFVTKNSPWTVFSLITSGGDISEYKIGIALMIIILIGMVVKERFFCQFLCPFGAVFSLMPHIPFVKLKRRSENCIPNCTLCKRNCPVNMKLQENELREGECIVCGRCKYGCPKNNISIIRKMKSSE